MSETPPASVVYPTPEVAWPHRDAMEAGISEEKMAHLLDDPLREGLFPPDEAAIVILARKSTRMEPIDNGTWTT